ncbi:class I SAM-dependent methyltransferase [Flexibacterium corallicola]|uniref:class I SAM-dependent methyltransferase n=1 Tax=Flexibacterium corallicola TaxID=3037259 RepID=UPI00286EC4F5|nr:class I SAM-dependent methyltransferase [Pseudovibrio sp. M1P-2-3]
MKNKASNEYDKTGNGRGITITGLPKASLDFIEFASQVKKPAIDMGCAFGVATKPLLNKRKKVFACDMSSAHLERLRSETPNDLLPYLSTHTGCFPQDFEFEENDIGAIHCSFLLHFLTGEELLSGLSKFKKWLDDDGKLFINVAMPSVPFLGTFGQDHEQRKQSMEWPGELYEKDLQHYLLPEFGEWIGPEAMFKFFHPMDKDILSRALTNSGFHIDELYIYTLEATGKLREYGGEDAHLSAIASR